MGYRTRRTLAVWLFGWTLVTVSVLAEDVLPAKLEALLMAKAEMLQTKLDQVQLKVRAGRAGATELRDARVALFSAQLAAMTNAPDRAKFHERLVLTHAEYCEAVQERFLAGRATQIELLDARLAVLQAKIDRERDALQTSGTRTDDGEAQRAAPADAETRR